MYAAYILYTIISENVTTAITLVMFLGEHEHKGRAVG